MFGCTTSPVAALFERFNMTRPSTASSTYSQSFPSKSKPTPPSSPKSPRHMANRLWMQEQQKRKYLDHLMQWSLNHESSIHFHGKLSISTQPSGCAQDLELGKAVKCVLTDAAFTDARQVIVIKLFPPDPKHSGRHKDQVIRRDSMEPCDEVEAEESKNDSFQGLFLEESPKEHYKMVIRCGAGWIPAREYFNRVYFSHLETQQGDTTTRAVQDEYMLHRSQALGPPPLDKDSVTVRPLFHAFQKLPPELREMILMTAAGLAGSFNLCTDDYGTLRVKNVDSRPAISLSTLSRINKSMNMNLIPFLYHSTDFHFGLTGFTNFLWQSGPTKRHEIRRLTFHFGKLALLHCIRWLAPDPVFSLFEPPVATNPRALQYFWRCQIQELVKDLHLFSLTFNIKQIPKADLPMIVAIMKSAFGSINEVRFIETDAKGVARPVSLDDEKLAGVRRQCTWRDLCMQYYEQHRIHSYFFKFELLKSQAEDVRSLMNNDDKFFGPVFLPLTIRAESATAEEKGAMCC
ncbi:hypothetical protein DE146DRAFT_715050 [Phaeosphaeria sp. MPI-PUGE-AT-0046c]|nr:hypothetical protein DE146DRAFT_715050 [Phaeosphaeria sp. MPI-PUGE-AT-0046c]